MATQPVIQPVPDEEVRDDRDSIVHVRNATWADYQRQLELRGEKAVPRITYLEGLLELMAPSRKHESQKSMIGRLVEAWCFETGVEISPFGSWTLESKESERGAEPDECYIVGEETDANVPDLAIEVVLTSGGIDKLEVYRKLGVREVWFYTRGKLRFFALRREPDDVYREIPHSELLPQLPVDVLLSCMQEPDQTSAVRALRARLAPP